MTKITVNKDPKNILSKISCFALDMDGTIYLGEQWIDGAVDFLHAVEESGRKYVFLTNNSSKNAEAYVNKLSKMGLQVTKDQIITSGQATIFYLQQNFPGKKVFLLGNDILKKEFLDAGITLVENEPEVVVVGFDTTLDYQKMCKVCDYVRAGLPYLTTHPDLNCPTEDGFIPDAGAIHAFINASSGRMPDVVIGKPNGFIMDYMLSRTGSTKADTIMVGDRLYTDVAAGVKNGLYGMLVLSGEAQLEDLEKSDVVPHLIFDSVKDVIAFL